MCVLVFYSMYDSLLRNMRDGAVETPLHTNFLVKFLVKFTFNPATPP
jgi:hypothetical protein